LRIPSWSNQKLGSVGAAWYRREFTVPSDWGGRRVVLRADYLNSFAAVYVDGKRAGEIRFPGGEVEITSAWPAGRQALAQCLCRSDAVEGRDAFLIPTPRRRGRSKVRLHDADCVVMCSLSARRRGSRIREVRVDTSVQRKEITFNAALDGLSANGRFLCGHESSKDGRTIKDFKSQEFSENDFKQGRFRVHGKMDT
jgi:hypothetical protein